MKKPEIWIFVGLATYLGLIGAVISGIHFCAEPGTYVSGSALIDSDGTLRIVGFIDEQLARSVRDALAQATIPVTRVTLNSRGGQSEAMQEIARTLKTTQAVLEVPAGATCQSACVGLLAKAPGQIVIAPNATLMFHAERSRVGLADQGPCGWLNAIGVWIQRILAPIDDWFAQLQGRDTTPVMQLWAQQLSPELPKVFALCPTNPLETDQGIFLTGSDVNSLREGEVKPEDLIKRCPT